jgi:hypothetical protein
VLKALKLISLIAILALTGCAQELQKLNDDLKALNQSLAGNQVASSPALAQRVESSQGTATQLIVPNDKSAADALDAALPTVKKVIGIHQCIKSWEGSRLLNFHAVPGQDFKYSDFPIAQMQYHDKNKCVGVRAIDQVTLLARNTLRARVVYFAEDSGEAANFWMTFKKVEDGTWKLDRIGT